MSVSEIIAYFNNEDRVAKHYPGKILKSTQFGEYSPTPLGPFNAGIDQLCTEGAIPREGILFDGGYGDGRILSLSAEKGYDPYGMEGDYELAQKGRTNDELLLDLGLRRRDRAVTLGHENFVSTRAYREQLGIFVSDINIFFNYQSNGFALAELIAVESPVGTKFIYLSNDPWAPRFAPQIAHRNTKKLDTEKPMYLRVYEKVSCQQNRKHSRMYAHVPRVPA